MFALLMVSSARDDDDFDDDGSSCLFDIFSLQACALSAMAFSCPFSFPSEARRTPTIFFASLFFIYGRVCRFLWKGIAVVRGMCFSAFLFV